MNTNPLPNYATGSGSVNALEFKGLESLEVSLNRIYEMLVEAGYKEGSCEDELINRDFYKYH